MHCLLSALALAASSAVSAPVSGETAPFFTAPVAEPELALVSGGRATASPIETLRSSADENARFSFDSTAAINRTTLDNWFAREGADLLSAEVLGRPLVFD